MEESPNISENQETNKSKSKFNYDKHYKLLFLIPIFILIVSLIYLFSFYSKTGDFIIKDVSLSGGTSITLSGEILKGNVEKLEQDLKSKYNDLSFRRLTDISSGRLIALVIESQSQPGPLKADIETITGYKLTNENSSIEFSGASLGSNFYRQLLIALIISFVLMSIVIFFLFRTFIPSIAVIFAAFADIVMPLALIDFLGIRVSTAGIAAFLMLIGYSVDTDILLTTRALKKQEGTLNERIYGAFKTGTFMTLTALFAVLPAFFLVTGLPDSFRQIFLILAIGLGADIVNTWLTNAGIIKWYCDKKGIK
jgi:preprotein translocase subunit SecF